MKIKYIYKLGLLGLLFFTFSACNDKEDEVVPEEPVAEVMRKIGRHYYPKCD